MVFSKFIGSKSKRVKYSIGVIAVIIIMAIFFYWQNNGITVTKITFENSKIPNGFDGFKIIHLSDLHNKEFGEAQKKLIKKVNDSNPDLIVFTGDLIDHTKEEKGDESFINAIKDVAPVYYVSGNHEAWSGKYDGLVAKLKENGITVLDNDKVKIEKNGEYINVLGIKDLAFFSNDTKVFEDELKKLMDKEESNDFKILLSHRPELMDLYVKNSLDLVFSGHAHGGQFRIPFIGGVLAPNRSLFPKYTSGMHTINNTSMIISRGLGNSIIPVRVFNRPEIIDITLKAK